MRRLVCWILGHKDEVVAHTGYEVRQHQRTEPATFYKSPILQCQRKWCRRVVVVPRQFVYGHPWDPPGGPSRKEGR